MATRAKNLNESGQLRLWLDGELAAQGVTAAELGSWRPEPIAKPAKRRKAAEPVVEATCARVTWKPGNSGRSWVCSDEEGKCQWCLDEEHHGYQRRIYDAHCSEVERSHRDSVPYGLLCADDRVAMDLIFSFGGATEAIAAILDKDSGYRDFTRWLPTLLAWEMPRGDALRRWHELLEQSKRMSEQAEHDHQEAAQ